MNERIRLIAKQAALATNEDPNGEYPARMMEKFAELIVGECADIANEPGARIPGYYIKKHFGVEE